MKKIIILTIVFCLFIEGLIVYYSNTLKTGMYEIAVATAKAHFDSMVDARSWNASHGGVYIKQHDGIVPNKYLQNNTLKTDKNETLIRVNPAWMTRQISIISSKRKNHHFHITSLQPINPNNKPDKFETKALKYFEKNKEKKYYSLMEPRNDGVLQLDFMGVLITKQSCIKCHEGYKEGDIRGGIRVSIPMDKYNNQINLYNIIEAMVIIFILIGFFIFLFLIKRYDKTQKDLRDKDKALLAKTKQAAMGEMLTMIAHQWRQPLSIISIKINKIIMSIELETFNSKKLYDATIDISDSVQELSKIIDIFSNMSRPSSHSEVMTIRSIQEEFCTLIENSEEFQDIEIIKDLNSTKKVNIYKNEFIQACFMLFKNSQEALSERDIKNPKIISRTWDEENSVHYSICDNGGGIKEKDISKAFEPYYTTKDLNRRGVGLTIVKSYIESIHKGKISIKNTKDGLCVHVVLPIAQ